MADYARKKMLVGRKTEIECLHAVCNREGILHGIAKVEKATIRGNHPIACPYSKKTYLYHTMSIKLTAQQKAKPIYTAADHASRLACGIYAIIQPILLRENRMRRKLEYFWVPMPTGRQVGIDNERHLKFAELLALGGQNRVHIKPVTGAGLCPVTGCYLGSERWAVAVA